MVPGSEWFMKNIYRKVLEKVGEGAKAPWDLKNALEANTSFSLCGIFSIFGIWSSVRDSLKSVNIPALSLRGTGWVEQANKWDWACHWRVVLGTRHAHREWQEKWTLRKPARPRFVWFEMQWLKLRESRTHKHPAGSCRCDAQPCVATAFLHLVFASISTPDFAMARLFGLTCLC